MNEDLTRAFRFKNYKLEKDEIPIFVVGVVILVLVFLITVLAVRIKKKKS